MNNLAPCLTRHLIQFSIRHYESPWCQQEGREIFKKSHNLTKFCRNLELKFLISDFCNIKKNCQIWLILQRKINYQEILTEILFLNLIPQNLEIFWTWILKNLIEYKNFEKTHSQTSLEFYLTKYSRNFGELSPKILWVLILWAYRWTDSTVICHRYSSSKFFLFLFLLIGTYYLLLIFHSCQINCLIWTSCLSPSQN